MRGRVSKDVHLSCMCVFDYFALHCTCNMSMLHTNTEVSVLHRHGHDPRKYYYFMQQRDLVEGDSAGIPG